ncbi:HTH-type transcriptional activator CmpR [Deinococcus xinjiangensis]|uniref:HTH-type transcriptional activator CmpR n=1 Tax=Deinococcus xinjiangensis TaxID=457454 RepID=A0ABP9VGV7_9DEIO
MNVQPEALLSFAAVARLGSVTAAAKERNLSQPALSAQLKHLTAAVGEPLLLRHKQGMRLTPAGQALLPHAAALANALTGARQFAVDYQGLRAGSLRIAASNTLAAHVLPAALQDFHQAYPGVQLQVSSGNSEDALAQLQRDEADLALIERPLTHLPTGMQSCRIGGDRLRLVLRPEHPLAKPKLSRSQLAQLPLIQRESGSGTREVAELALAAVGLQLSPLLELSGTEAVREAVLAGLGGAFLSEYCIRRELASGLLVSPEVPLVGLERHFHAVLPIAPSRAVLEFLRNERLKPQL